MKLDGRYSWCIPSLVTLLHAAGYALPSFPSMH
jgi:hypothetical protein